jgi:hypothetical protein
VQLTKRDHAVALAAPLVHRDLPVLKLRRTKPLG